MQSAGSFIDDVETLKHLKEKDPCALLGVAQLPGQPCMIEPRGPNNPGTRPDTGPVSPVVSGITQVQAPMALPSDAQDPEETLRPDGELDMEYDLVPDAAIKVQERERGVMQDEAQDIGPLVLFGLVLLGAWLFFL